MIRLVTIRLIKTMLEILWQLGENTKKKTYNTAMKLNTIQIDLIDLI